MSLSKSCRGKAASDRTYTREALLKSERFAAYQKDFLGAVLKKPAYTLDEAERAVRGFFGKEV